MMEHNEIRSNKGDAANLEPDQSLEGLKMEYAGRFASIAQEQRPDMVVETIEALFTAVARECAKARLEELEGAKANFVGGKYYQDPVEYFDARIESLKEEL